MGWEAALSGRRGRLTTFADAAIEAGLMRDGRSLGCRCARRPAWWRARLEARQAGLACARRQHLGPTAEGPHGHHPTPVQHRCGSHLLIDSPGIKARGEGEWSACKPGASRPRQWCKVHLGIEAATLESRAIEGEQANATGPREPANGSRVGDGPLQPKLLQQIPAEEAIGTVTAEGAYDTRARHAALATRQATALGGAPVHWTGS